MNFRCGHEKTNNQNSVKYSQLLVWRLNRKQSRNVGRVSRRTDAAAVFVKGFHGVLPP